MDTIYHEDVRQLDDVLSRAQAHAIIREATTRGFAPAGASYPPSYRNNDRLVIDDAALAAQVFERLAPHLPATIEHDGATWELSGLNARWRYCRYHAGQQFTIHRDGAYHDGSNRRSFLTVMFYLNDASEFTGGTTRFYRDRTGAGAWLTVPPRCGTAIVFPHAAWHDGAPVTGGEKVIMRTDVLYRRRTPVVRTGHDGYVWAIAPLSGGRHATGGRDRTLRIWRDGTCTEVVPAHDLSVTAVGSDGTDRVWTGSRDGTLCTWHVAPGGTRIGIRTHAHDGAIVAMTGAVGGRFATGSADASIAIWTTDGTFVERIHRHRSWVWALAWDAERRLVSGSEDGTIMRGDRRVDAGAPVHALACVGDHLLTGDGTGALAWWDASLACIARWPVHDGPITAVLALPGGLVATAGEDGHVNITRLADGARTATWAFDDHVRCLALGADGQLLCGGYDGDLHRLGDRSATADHWRSMTSRGGTVPVELQ